MRRVLRAAAVFAVLLVVTGLVTAGQLVARPFPPVNIDARLLGLHERGEIVTDTDGVPHVFANNTHDLFFLQGYATAQDRLFQMDFFRRIGRGTLSEVLGRSALETDRFTRTVGFLRAADEDARLMSAESRAAIEAYADGVNKLIDQRGNELPLEFVMLGYRPAQWTILDTLVVLKLQSYDLSGNYRQELLRANLALRLGPESLAALMPGPTAVAAGWDAVAPHLSVSAPPTSGFGGMLGASGGSNCWALAGTRTASGAPMLAGDPHLAVRNPSTWYEIDLQGPGYQAAGFSIPGLPGVVIGHNARVAWSLTVGYADVQDLYVERFDPLDLRRVQYAGASEPMRLVREEIAVKGAEPEILDVAITRHGPIVSPMLDGQVAPLALRWSGLDGGRSIDALLGLGRAADWDSFRAALAFFRGAVFSVCYADVDGHIGYALAGDLPRREGGGDGSLPLPGWTGEHEWNGYLDQAANPAVFDPPSGLIVNANDRPSADPESPGYAGEWDSGFRAQRLRELLEPMRGADAQALLAVQLDLASRPAAQARDLLASLDVEGPNAARARELLAAWDGRIAGDSAAAAVYEAWMVEMLELTFRDKLERDLYRQYLGDGQAAAALHALLAYEEHPLLVSLGDDTVRGRDVLAALALRRALDALGERLGADPATWRWDRLHTVTFAHPLSPALGPLAGLFDVGPVALAGDAFTVQQSAYSYAEPFAVTNHQSERMIVDLGDFTASWSVTPLGQSALPFARYRTNQNGLWRDGGMHPLRFGRGPLVETSGTLVFRPR